MYNEHLVREYNAEVALKLTQLSKEDIYKTIHNIAKKIFANADLAEYLEGQKIIDGETYRGIFVLEDGIFKTWCKLKEENPHLFGATAYYETIWDYLNECLDEMDFDSLFAELIKKSQAII